VRVFRTVVLAGAVASAVAVMASGMAAADPPAGTVPANADIVAVGSNTIQALFNAWSTDYNVSTPIPTSKLYSFDATGSATINEKTATACQGLTRPNGSGAGIAALNTGTVTGDGHFCVDIARSSRPTTPADGTVKSVLLAEDAISWSASSTTNAPATLTSAQLKAIFNCTDTKWNQVGGTSTATIVPILPQSSSGTRQTWLTQIGVTTPGTCVTNASGATAIEENEGTNTVFTGANAPNVLFPFSVGSYISQKDILSSPNLTGSLALKNVAGVAPTTGTGTATKINTAFPSAFFRGLFAVVRGTSIPAYLQPLLGNGTAGTGWACTATKAKADVTNQGFLTTPNCGI
jgi:ABC-type phosphate transport system substrate-binding protein